MYSSAPSTVVNDTGSEHRLFVNEFVSQLRAPELTAEEVFNRTRMGVTRGSQGQQVPWLSSSLVSDFSFARQPAGEGRSHRPPRGARDAGRAPAGGHSENGPGGSGTPNLSAPSQVAAAPATPPPVVIPPPVTILRGGYGGDPGPQPQAPRQSRTMPRRFTGAASSTPRTTTSRAPSWISMRRSGSIRKMRKR